MLNHSCWSTGCLKYIYYGYHLASGQGLIKVSWPSWEYFKQQRQQRETNPHKFTILLVEPFVRRYKRVCWEEMLPLQKPLRLKALGKHCSGKGWLFTKHYLPGKDCKGMQGCTCEIYLLPGKEQEPEENACVSWALNNSRGGAACSSFWWHNQSSLPTLVQSLPRSMQRLPLTGRGWNPWIQMSIALQEVHHFMLWMQHKQWNKDH